MSIKTRKYTNHHTGEVRRGIKVTVNNIETIAEWCNGDAVQDTFKYKDGLEVSRNRVKVNTKNGVRVAQIGDVVVRPIMGTDKQWVYSIVKNSDLVKYYKVS